MLLFCFLKPRLVEWLGCREFGLCVWGDDGGGKGGEVGIAAIIEASLGTLVDRCLSGGLLALTFLMSFCPRGKITALTFLLS